MSYSFSITAKTKVVATERVKAELDRIVNGQPSHAADRDAAQNAAEASISVLIDPAENEEIFVAVSGSLSWRKENVFTNASLSVSAGIKTTS